jgi:hypothetical protein
VLIVSKCSVNPEWIHSMREKPTGALATEASESRSNNCGQVWIIFV